MTRDPLAPFDGGVVSAVAADHGVPESRLVDLLGRQQERVRDLRGVDGLVYEYRKAFARSPVAARRPDAFYLLVPGHVWPEFGEALDCSSEELAALMDVHDRTFRLAVGDHDDDRAPLVFAREGGEGRNGETDE